VDNDNDDETERESVHALIGGVVVGVVSAGGVEGVGVVVMVVVDLGSHVQHRSVPVS